MLDNALLIDSVKNRQKLVERTKQLNCNVVVFDEIREWNCHLRIQNCSPIWRRLVDATPHGHHNIRLKNKQSKTVVKLRLFYYFSHSWATTQTCKQREMPWWQLKKNVQRLQSRWHHILIMTMVGKSKLDYNLFWAVKLPRTGYIWTRHYSTATEETARASEREQ
jgi:hypothetical protein